MPLIEIDEVKMHALDSGIISFNLETPKAGGRGDIYALKFSGQLQHSYKLKMTSLMINEEIGTNNSYHPLVENGSNTLVFNFSTSLLGFPLKFEFVLSAVMEDGTVFVLATINGRRQPVQSSFRPGVQPLMLTGIGRTGTTVLMKVLSLHPAILAHRIHPYEVRASSYWMQFLKVLSAPYPDVRANVQAIYKQQATIGPNLSYIPKLTHDPNVKNWLGVQYVQDMAAFCQKSLEDYYENVAKGQKQRSYSYFIEKHHPSYIPLMLWDLYPKAREIILVRDFRDMLCSINAFNVKKGSLGFGRARVETDEDYILQLRERGVSQLYRAWQQRQQQAHLVRYEDIILKPESTISGILQYLKLKQSDSIIQKMVSEITSDGNEVDRARTESHRTSESPEKSIGRWKTELSSSLQELCNNEFGHILQAFGYQN
jgi:hypothetical protein